ncbi:MAG TPA: tetratricopeptide repeat protein [Thermoanaerobaculia bacterium]|nr:tetratricopeptide repeat protein [Thermoanaerobaculia bacterium]
MMSFPEIGGSVAHFKVLERLGRGGMGIVYKARDLRLGRLVALKFMTSDDEASAAARQRFLREAQAASALDHPNVCTLYEIGETDGGQTFLAMAFCEGETLRSRLRSGPLDPREAVEIAIQVADGLAAAHARGIIHRDVHPGNILVSDGLVKIVDFGVARLTDQTRMTQDGVMVGTISYAAPEQICGEQVGPAADLWSLGVVLYEAIAGCLPFRASSVPALFLTILEGAPPPLQGVSPEIERVLTTALQKLPERRYSSAEAMRADLRLALSENAATWIARPVPAIARTGPPQLHNLPFPPLGELFKGRTQELQSLAEALQKKGPNVIHGLGGIGKTRLAVEHAWRQGRRYQAVLFVLADSTEGLYSGLAALARRDLLNLPERDDPAEAEVVGAVLRWLRENADWLLILDSVDTKEAQLAVIRLLPALAEGRTLLTSRRRDWPAVVQRHPIDLVPLEAAKDFLLQRTKQVRRREPDDEAQALRLGELLDGLPLALEQAAGYIAHTQISLAEYLDIWESECDSVLGWYDEGVMQYPASLAVTWQRTFRQIAPTAQALLLVIAHLASDPIPVEMLESGAQLIHEAARRLGLDVAPRPFRDDLAELAALSLISRQGALITAHCLVQEVIRSRIQEEQKTAWIELAVAVVERFGPRQADYASTWPTWDLLRPHAAQVLARASGRDLEDGRPLSRLSTALSLLLCARSRYKDAEPLMRSVLELDERLFGLESRAAAVCLLNLGELLRRTGRPEQAEPLLRRSLDIYSAICGESAPEACKALNCLALILMDRNRWTEAETMLRKALAQDEERKEGTGPSITRDLHNLALLLASTGRTAEAEPLIRRSLEISLQVHGKNDPQTARKMQILAGVLRDLGRTDEVEPLARQALEIFEQVLGPDNPMTQSARKDLSSLTAV